MPPEVENMRLSAVTEPVPTPGNHLAVGEAPRPNENLLSLWHVAACDLNHDVLAKHVELPSRDSAELYKT